MSPAVIRGYAYAAPWRLVVALLTALSGASLLVLFGLLLWANDPPLTPAPLLVLFGGFVLLPAALGWGIRRLSAASVEVDHLTMAINSRGFRLEVPGTAIEAIVPWVIPLPGPGFAVRLRSGRTLRYGVQVAAAAQVLRALIEAADVAVAARAARHPSVIYAAAKWESCPSGWLHVVLKFALFSLFPAGVLFNAHQHIAYGGSLGEYYLLGLQSYVTTFAVYWATTAIYLVLYAGVWRMLAEAVALAAAWLTQAYAATVRRVAENICSVAYYGGVPLLLLIRFLP